MRCKLPLARKCAFIMPCMPRLIKLLIDRDCGPVCLWKLPWYLSVTHCLVHHAGRAGRIPGFQSLCHPSTAKAAEKASCDGQLQRWQNLMAATLLTGPTPSEHLRGRSCDRIHKGLEACPGAQGIFSLLA